MHRYNENHMNYDYFTGIANINCVRAYDAETWHWNKDKVIRR